MYADDSTNGNGPSNLERRICRLLSGFSPLLSAGERQIPAGAYDVLRALAQRTYPWLRQPYWRTKLVSGSAAGVIRCDDFVFDREFRSMAAPSHTPV